MAFEQIQDIEVLHTLLKMQQKESARLKRELTEAHAKLQSQDIHEAEQLALRLHELEKQHAKALKGLFGPKSERRPHGVSAPAEKKPQRGHGPKQQPELPVQEVIHTLSAVETQCELCAEPMKAWEGQFEESSEIDFVEPKLIIKKHLRQKYRCTCGGCVKTAPGPKKLFPKARYSIDFAINVALQKHCYHMPLSRQVRELGRYGLEVSTATLWDYLFRLYELLEPASERLAEYILAQPVIGADETSWRLLKGEKKGKSKRWWVWARRCQDAVHYTLDSSRGKAIAEQLFGSYEGTVLCDGYVVYESLANTNPKMKLANCWGHARREFLSYEEDPKAQRVIRVIQRLYQLEKKVRGERPETVLALRQRKTKKLLQALFKWIDTLKLLPNHGLGKAFRYVQLRKVPLMRFLHDPRICPDNNGSERALRGVVVGRKNHYGSRSERGTKVAALFYSLVESAELAGVNPHDYLRRAVHAALDGAIIPLPHELK